MVVSPRGVVGAVYAVVNQDNGQVDVSSGGMNEMISTDGGQIAVSAGNHDMAFRSSQFYAGGKGNGSAVGGMEGVCGKKRAGYPSRAADSGYKDEIVHV